MNDNIISFLQAISNGLVVADESDENDYVSLVDENRKADNFKPLKSLVTDIEKDELVEIISKDTKREYIKFDGKKHPLSLITIYKLSQKGIDYLKKHRA